jgi:hypothetical protein
MQMASAGPKIIVDDGIAYLYDKDRLKFLGTRVYLRYGAAGRKVSNQYLKMEDGSPSMAVGDMIPRNGTIVGITTNTEQLETWEAEVYKNQGATPVASLVIGNLSKLSSTNFNIDVNSGDIIQVRAKGSDITMPRVLIEIAWRL